jgi:hypothetical protein
VTGAIARVDDPALAAVCNRYWIAELKIFGRADDDRHVNGDPYHRSLRYECQPAA